MNETPEEQVKALLARAKELLDMDAITHEIYNYLVSGVWD